MKMNIKTARKGFTLIELLVVIAIIGVLASVVLASLNTARRKSRDTRRVADIKQIQLALEMEFDKATSYPAALSTLVTDGFIPSVPQDPILTRVCGAAVAPNYCYAVSGTSYYHLGANLEESTGTALQSDKDCNSTALTCPAGVAYTNGFDGGGSIYDVVP